MHPRVIGARRARATAKLGRALAALSEKDGLEFPERPRARNPQVDLLFSLEHLSHVALVLAGLEEPEEEIDAEESEPDSGVNLQPGEVGSLSRPGDDDDDGDAGGEHEALQVRL